MFIMNDFDISRNYGSGYTYGYTADRYGIKHREYGYYDREKDTTSIFRKFLQFFSTKKKVKKHRHP